MAKDFSDMEDSNRSSNPDIHSLSAPHRLQVLVNGQQLADISSSTPADSARYGLLVIAKDNPERLFLLVNC